LGTSTALIDFNGNAYQFFLNLPFGETMAEQLPTSTFYNTPYKFNGKELDEETGLYYYCARYYDPKISIWYSVDPMAETYPNVNPYVYCLENPIIYNDPDGRKIVVFYMDHGKEKSFTYSYSKNRNIKSIDNNKFLRNTIKMLDKLVSTGATRNINVSGDKGENCGDRILQIVNDPRQLSMIEVKNKENVCSIYSPVTYLGEKKSNGYGNDNYLGTIEVNDELGVQINSSSDIFETNSPTAQLGHEILHEEHFKNDFDRFAEERKGHPVGGNKEERLTNKEANQINSGYTNLAWRQS
jgi:RHS repeat-associated protein